MYSSLRIKIWSISWKDQGFRSKINLALLNVEDFKDIQILDTKISRKKGYYSYLFLHNRNSNNKETMKGRY